MNTTSSDELQKARTYTPCLNSIKKKIRNDWGTFLSLGFPPL